jgi:hypothetical protein
MKMTNLLAGNSRELMCTEGRNERDFTKCIFLAQSIDIEAVRKFTAEGNKIGYPLALILDGYLRTAAIEAFPKDCSRRQRVRTQLCPEVRIIEGDATSSRFRAS